jgi:hypothetical protein
MAAYHMFPLVGPMTHTNRSQELKWAIAFIDFPHFKRPYMGWVSWSLLGSILFGILGTYIWLDQLGRVPFNYLLPNASELTWQVIIISLFSISYMILLADNVLTNREKRTLKKLKRTPPVVNAWLEIEYGGYFMIVIKCENSVPINFKWCIGTMTRDNQKGSFRPQVSSGNEFEVYYPSSSPREQRIYADSRMHRFPVSYAASIADTYNVVMIVRYRSIYLEEIQYKDELEGEIIRKYELVDYSLKEVQ